MKLHRYLFPVLSLLVAQTSYATLLYQQNFDGLTLGGLNGQDTFTALSAAQVTAATSGRQVTYTTPAAANNHAFINTFPEQSGTVYFSFTMSWTGQDLDDFLYFALSNDADAAPVALANSAGVVINGFASAGGTIGSRIRNTSTTQPTGTLQVSSGTAGGVNSSSTYTFVGSLSKVSSTNYNTFNLWINPSAGPEGVASQTLTLDLGISSGLDTFFLFSGSSNEVGEIVLVDNILIGTTYADVVTAAVPEPSTYAAFAGVSVLGLAALRRRRN